MPLIDTPLLIVGSGPGALVAAKTVSGAGLPCLVAGHPTSAHTSPGQVEPVVLDEESIAVLTPHGVLDVLRPYASTQDPFTIAPARFEAGLKHHCVADMLITVFDGMTLIDPTPAPDGAGITGILTDGRTRWDLQADAFLDVATLAPGLNDAIHQAAAFGRTLLATITR